MKDGAALRVAFVIERWGENESGRAIAACARLIARMRSSIDVRIITTCARTARASSTYLPGNSIAEGIHVRRSPSPAELLAHIERCAGFYDTFVFVDVGSATTRLGVSKVRGRAILLPVAEDDAALRFPQVEKLFADVRAVIFVNANERDRVGRLIPTLPAVTSVMASGVEAAADRNAERFRAFSGVTEPFVLFAGWDASPGDAISIARRFVRYYDSHGGIAKKLVIAGATTPMERPHPAFVVVPEAERYSKWDALAACDVLVQPSVCDRVPEAVYEAWACGRPVLVAARSTVLVRACREAAAGIWYATDDELAAALDVLDAEMSAVLGRQGSDYVNTTYERNPALDSDVELFEAIAPALQSTPE